MFNKHFIPLRVVHKSNDEFIVTALGNPLVCLKVHLDETYYEKITERKITPEELVEFAVRYLNEEKAKHRPLPENIYLARIKHFYPSFEVEVAQHIKDRWKPFVWRKFKFDLLGAIKLGLKCTFWPFALMPLYLRALRGYGKLEDIFAYVFVLSVGFPYLLGPFLRTIFQ